MNSEAFSLGILGLGSRSTLYYLQQLNEGYNKRRGGYATFPLTLLNTDFDEINQLLPNHSLALSENLNQYISQFGAVGISHLLIPNITLHHSIDQLDVSYSIIHPLHLTLEKIQSERYKQVTLFGSIHTMTSGFVIDFLTSNGIQVGTPKQDEKEFIDEVRKRIFNYDEDEALLQQYQQLVKKYADEGPLIVACTELSIPQIESHEAIIDMAKMQIDEVIDLKVIF